MRGARARQASAESEPTMSALSGEINQDTVILGSTWKTKDFLLLIIVLGVVGYLYQRTIKPADDPSNPETITNPVYAELKVGLEVAGRSYDQVLLVKAVDQADCDKVQQKLETVYGPNAVKAGQSWKIKSSECMVELEPRYAKLFDNRPSYVTYVSMGRGDRQERESRIVTWGVTVDESNKLCEGIAQGQKNRKGAIQCIRAVPSQS